MSLLAADRKLDPIMKLWINYNFSLRLQQLTTRNFYLLWRFKHFKLHSVLSCLSKANSSLYWSMKMSTSSLWRRWIPKRSHGLTQIFKINCQTIIITQSISSTFEFTCWIECFAQLSSMSTSPRVEFKEYSRLSQESSNSNANLSR